jgi:hypothetical protein
MLLAALLVRMLPPPPLLVISVRHPFGLMVYNFLFSAVSAYSGPFWKKMEPMLTFMSSENLSFLKNQVGASFAIYIS